MNHVIKRNSSHALGHFGQGTRGSPWRWLLHALCSLMLPRWLMRHAVFAKRGQLAPRSAQAARKLSPPRLRLNAQWSALVRMVLLLPVVEAATICSADPTLCDGSFSGTSMYAHAACARMC